MGVVLTEVFAASEAPLAGGRSVDLFECVKVLMDDVEYAAKLEDAYAILQSRAKPEDICILMGAGDIDELVNLTNAV